MESVKYHYRVLMIKDLFQMMGFIRPAHFHKDLKKQILTYDHKEKELLTDNRDSKRFS